MYFFDAYIEITALSKSSSVLSVYPEATALDVLALTSPTSTSRPFISATGASPNSKRNDQEARVQLRKSLRQFEPPYVRVQRHGVGHSVLSTAIQFSESLAIGPASGPKNVTAFCISPLQGYSSEGVHRFHTTMKDAYMSRLLGNYTVGETDSEDLGHIIVRSLDATCSLEDATRQYRETASAFGKFVCPLLFKC